MIDLNKNEIESSPTSENEIEKSETQIKDKLDKLKSDYEYLIKSTVYMALIALIVVLSTSINIKGEADLIQRFWTANTEHSSVDELIKTKHSTTAKDFDIAEYMNKVPSVSGTRKSEIHDLAVEVQREQMKDCTSYLEALKGYEQDYLTVSNCRIKGRIFMDAVRKYTTEHREELSKNQ